MKTYTTIVYRCLLFLGAMFGMAACADVDFSDDDFVRKPMSFTAGRSFDPTRAATTNVQGDLFDADEEINVFIQGSIDGGSTWTETILDHDGEAIGTSARPAVFVTSAFSGGYNKLSSKTTSTQPYYPMNPPGGITSDVKAKIYAAYPTSATPLTPTFTVQYDQSTDRGYKNSDLMLITPFEHSKNNEVINLPFRHKMTKLIVSAIPDGGVTIDDEITLGWIKRRVEINVLTGDFVRDVSGDPVVSDENESDLKTCTIKILNGGAAVFPPQFLEAASRFIMITGKDESGQPQSAQFNILDKTFEEGRVYKLNLHISQQDFTPNPNNGEPHISTITGWSADYDELTVTPSGGYSGVTIADIDGNVGIVSTLDETVTGAQVEEGCYVYTGQPRCPKPAVTYGDGNIPMVEGTDFKYVYIDNVNASANAQVMVQGMGSYAGLAALKPFTIKRAKAKITFPEGSDKTGDRAVYYNPDETLNDLDELVQYINTGDGDVIYSVIADGTGESADCASVDPVDGIVTIQNVGTCTILATASAGRNYDYPSPDNTCKYKIEIKPKEVTETNLTVTYTPTEFTYDGYEKKLTTLVVADGEYTLAEGVDYEYTFLNNEGTGAPIHQGTYTLVIRGKGNYNSSTDIEFPIKVNKAKPTIEMTKDRKKFLWLGQYNPSAPKDRRTTRLATTNDWARESLYYQSENAEIVTVNSSTGLITGVAEGETFIVVGVSADASANQDYIAADTIKFPVKVVKSDYTFKLNRRTVSGYDEPQVERNATTGVPVGAHSEWICPAKGLWQLDCYGAQGAGTPKRRYVNSGAEYTAKASGGKGAHIAGRVELPRGKHLFVNVGEQGRNVYTGSTRNTTQVPHGYYELDGFAWNGGGNVVWGGLIMMDAMGSAADHSDAPYNTDATSSRNVVQDVISGGGGATDISLSWAEYPQPAKMKINQTGFNARFFDWKSAAHLYSRIIVAGGGGGGIYYAGEGGFGNGGDGGAWNGGDGLWFDYGEGAKMDRPGFGGMIQSWKTSPTNSPTTWRNMTMRNQMIFYREGPFAGGYSCTDGMFGEGGNYTQTRQGCGAGGGGWYGGGSGGEQSSNGSGGGGSSFLWSEEYVTKSSAGGNASVKMYTLYDTIDSDWNNYLRFTPTHDGRQSNWHEGDDAYENTSFAAQFGAISNFKPYMPTTSSTVAEQRNNNNYIPYMTKVISDPGANPGDGWAKITLVQIDEDQ